MPRGRRPSTSAKQAGVPPRPPTRTSLRRKRVREEGGDGKKVVAATGAAPDAGKPTRASSLASECKRLRMENVTACAEVRRLRLQQDKVVGAWLSETAQLREEQARAAASAERRESSLRAENEDLAGKLVAAHKEMDAAREREQRRAEEVEEVRQAAAVKLGKLESERATLAATLSRQRSQDGLGCPSCGRSKAGPEKPSAMSDNRKKIKSILHGTGISSILHRLLY